MEINTIITNLSEEYPTEVEKIRQIKPLLEQIETNDDKAKPLEELQEIVNKLYLITYTDTLLELQVIINQFRQKYDITDPREIINWDNGKGFVQ